MDAETLRREAEAPVQATAADLAEVVQTLSDAFARDPHMDWFMRADAGRDAARLAFFDMLVRRLGFPTARIDRPASGGAAAIWMPFEWLQEPPPLQGELMTLPM